MYATTACLEKNNTSRFAVYIKHPELRQLKFITVLFLNFFFTLTTEFFVILSAVVV